MKRLSRFGHRGAMLLLLALTGCRHDACGPVDPGQGPQAALQATLDACWVAGGAPGVALAVVSPDGAWSAAAGTADLERDIPMSPSSVFRGGSVTKTFTAALVFQLIEAGQLSLEAPLSTWFPGLPSSEQITIRDLLGMTSGLADYMDTDALTEHRLEVWTPPELIGAAESAGPLAAPGELFHYANTNFVLLAMVVEAITGRSYEENLETALLAPLGLDATYLDVGDPGAAPLVRGYTDRGGWVDIGDQTDPSVFWAAAAMASTVQDLADWGWLLYRGQVLSPESTAAMTEAASARFEDQWYGLGAMVYETQVGTALGHKGRTSGHFTWFGYLPDYDLAVATYANSSEDFADPRPAAWAAASLFAP